MNDTPRFVSAASLSLEAFADIFTRSYEGYAYNVRATAPDVAARVRTEQLDLHRSLVMLVGTSIMLGMIWPLMGAVIAIGSVVYIGITVWLSVSFVSPAASLANMWDTRMGGALADAISCNAVVKGFGAEDREEERLGHVVGKWRSRTARTWNRGTLNGGIQGATLIVLRTAIVGVATSIIMRVARSRPGSM